MEQGRADEQRGLGRRILDQDVEELIVEQRRVELADAREHCIDACMKGRLIEAKEKAGADIAGVCTIA